jgi:hypothetical protein
VWRLRWYRGTKKSFRILHYPIRDSNDIVNAKGCIMIMLWLLARMVNLCIQVRWWRGNQPSEILTGSERGDSAVWQDEREVRSKSLLRAGTCCLLTFNSNNLQPRFTYRSVRRIELLYILPVVSDSEHVSIQRLDSFANQDAFSPLGRPAIQLRRICYRTTDSPLMRQWSRRASLIRTGVSGI